MSQSDRVEVIQDAARAVVALHPIRLKILEMLADPQSPSSLSKSIGIPRQHLNYHVRELEAAGLVEMVEEKRKGSVVERIYQSTSKSYVVSPKALGGLRASPTDVSDRFSSDYLIAVGSKLIEDVVNLRENRATSAPAVNGGSRVVAAGVSAYPNRRRQTIPTMALETEIGFASDADRTAFAREITAAVSRIAANYDNQDGEKFRVAIFAHPNVTEGEQFHAAAPEEAESAIDITRVSYQVFVLASRENVFDALTNPERAKYWAGQFVDIDVKDGGAYTVWGKNVFGGPSKEDASGEIVAFEAPSKISIRTSFHYGNCIVTWTLTEKDYGTLVQLESVLPENQLEATHYLNADFAELALYNLKSYIESGEAACQPDYSGRKDSLTVMTKIAASPSSVFAALTDPNEMDKWISSEAVVEPRKHGTYSYGWTEVVDGKQVDAGPTRITDFVADSLLSHGWQWPGESGPTQVTWKLVPQGSMTAVSLIHRGFAEGEKVDSYNQGWAAFLGRLKALKEGKTLVAKV